LRRQKKKVGEENPPLKLGEEEKRAKKKTLLFRWLTRALVGLLRRKSELSFSPETTYPSLSSSSSKRVFKAQLLVTPS